MELQLIHVLQSIPEDHSQMVLFLPRFVKRCLQKNQQEMLMPSVVSLPEKSAPVQASLAPLSSDDSLETLDAEVEDSQIPDFSGEFEQIEKDIQGL